MMFTAVENKCIMKKKQEEKSMEKKYWLHRISHYKEVSYKLFEKGYLSLGWSDYSNLGILDIARKNTDEFENNVLQKDKKNRSRWNMWYFARFRVGDIIIVPLSNGEFNVCEVLDLAKPIGSIQNEIGDFYDENDQLITWDNGSLIRENEKIDLGFVIKVKPLKNTNIKRSEYADKALTARMKMRQTNGDISDIAESVELVIEANSPIRFYNIALEKGAEELQKIIDKKINPDKFERLVKAYMEKIGANDPEIPAKNESGKKDKADADVIADFDLLRVTIIVQVKHHKEKTGKWAVEQISKYKKQMEDKDSDLSHIKDEKYTNIAWVISSCDDFDDEAIDLAESENVRLINGSEFAKMLLDAGLSEIDV